MNLESSRDVTRNSLFFFRKHEIETMRALYPRSFNKLEGENESNLSEKGKQKILRTIWLCHPPLGIKTRGLFKPTGYKQKNLNHQHLNVNPCLNSLLKKMTAKDHFLCQWGCGKTFPQGAKAWWELHSINNHERTWIMESNHWEEFDRHSCIDLRYAVKCNT